MSTVFHLDLNLRLRSLEPEGSRHESPLLLVGAHHGPQSFVPPVFLTLCTHLLELGFPCPVVSLPICTTEVRSCKVLGDFLFFDPPLRFIAKPVYICKRVCSFSCVVFSFLEMVLFFTLLVVECYFQIENLT